MPSYRRMMSFPIFRLYKDGLCVASVRAWDAKSARNLFKYHGHTGGKMKKIVPKQ